MKPVSDIAIVPVRRSELPNGAIEAASTTGGRVWLIGDGATEAATDLAGAAATELIVTESPTFCPGALAEALAPHLSKRRNVVLPGSADGRDLAPRIAHVLKRRFVAYALDFEPGRATVVHHGGRVEVDLAFDGPVVATLQTRGLSSPDPPASLPSITRISLEIDSGTDAAVTGSFPPDPATVALADATRIVAAGAGLSQRSTAERLGRLGERIGAALGATRVVTDAGWLPHERQIGTTGIEVNPELYLAFGISGAVQHVMGLGNPAHIIAVNTDSSCPMMAMADLAVVSDANATIDELASRLESET